MTNKQLEILTNLIMARFQKANIDYIKRVTRHIEEIGQLSATDIHILDQFLMIVRIITA